MSYGLNSYGFSRPTLSQIIQDVKDSFLTTYGSNINVQENSYLDKFLTILANRESDVWEVLEDVYYSQTLSGAEAKYLDDILNQRGIFRKTKAYALGYVQLSIDNTVLYTNTYSAGTLTIKSGTFSNTSDVTVAGNIIAQKILNTNLNTSTAYVFTIVNTDTHATDSLTLTPTSVTIGSTGLNNFYNSIKNFIVSNTISANSDLIQIDTVNGILYIGYDTSLNLKGLSTAVDFKSTPIIGTRTVAIEMKAVNAGLAPITANSVTTFDTNPSGYVSVINIEAFYSGSEVESDSAYRARAESTNGGSSVATRDAIVTGLLEVEGVKSVKLFPNPTGNISSSGIPPYKLLTVVYGGANDDIGAKLYSLIGANTNTHGEYSYIAATKDSSTETIYFSKADERNLSCRVSYKTVNGKPLSDSEQTAITTQLTALAGTFNINSTIFNLQLQSAVTAGVSLSRFSYLAVALKNVSAPDSAYSTADLTPALQEICLLSEDNISFLQVS